MDSTVFQLWVEGFHGVCIQTVCFLENVSSKPFTVAVPFIEPCTRQDSVLELVDREVRSQRCSRDVDYVRYRPACRSACWANRVAD